MKKSLVMAMAMAMGVTASAYAANPFSDVPAGHWAYNAVAQLAAAGVVDGYGTVYGGEKLMTRYEMAQVVAKAMAKGANTDKLSAEFADELDALGVRVAKLEKKTDNVKITGQIRYSYRNNNDEATGHGNSYNRFRTRLFVNGAVNDDWAYTGMLENNRYFDSPANGNTNNLNLKRAYVTGRVGGIKVKGGRMNFLPTTMFDEHADGLEVKYTFDKINVVGAVAKTLDAVKTLPGTPDRDRVYMVQADTKISKLDLALRYWKADYSLDNTKIWDIALAYPLGDALKLSGEYWHGSGTNDETNGGTALDGKSGYEFKLAYKGAKASKPGSWGAYVDYQKRPYHTFLNPTCLAAFAHVNEVYGGDGYKGWEMGANYAFAKNIVGTIKYFDYTPNNENTTGHTHTVWGDVTFSF